MTLLYHKSMFVRERINKSGSKSVQVVEKRNGKIKVLKHVGTAIASGDLEYLHSVADKWIRDKKLSIQTELFPEKSISYSNDFFKRFTNPKCLKVGFYDIFGSLWNSINLPQDNKTSFLKDVVIARIAYPKSKRKVAWWLNTYTDTKCTDDQVYLLMDRLNHSVRISLNDCIFNFVKELKGGSIAVVFFDATTLHFETFESDDLRKTGFSKVGKHNQPQVVIGLMVTEEGLPIGYDIYPGSKFDGHTIRSALARVSERYGIDKVIFVADAAMMSERNLNMLEKRGFGYIISAKIRGMPKHIQEILLNKGHYKNNICETKYGNRRLIVSYSEDRARKDKKLRDEDILRKKRKILCKPSIKKSHLGRFGKTRYFKLKGNASVEIDYEAVDEDSQWDGLKGYITNLSQQEISSDLVIRQYTQLWQVEKAFRISKTDLKIRPIFHWKPKRIRSHILITFLSLFLVRYVEYRLRKYSFNPEKIIESIDTVIILVAKDERTGVSIIMRPEMNDTVLKIYKEFNLPVIHNSILFSTSG